LFVGRLAPEKNVSTLLDAFGQYLDSGGTWRLVIAGEGPLNGALCDQADAHIRDGAVVFTGHKNIHELPSLYAFAGCFVLPSLSETWGLVVNEAMASGLPVIVSSRCGCTDDLVEDGSNGFIIDSSSASSIAAGLARMSKLSLEERVRMGERSQTIIADYSPERWSREVQWIVGAVGKDNPVNES
jgi:glycosyltransferase involved in cell wall biosynthesis